MAASTKDRLLGAFGGILVLTILGGAFGFAYATGLVDAVRSVSSDSTYTRERLRNRAMEPMTDEEYQHRALLGGGLGMLAGASLGVVFFRGDFFKKSKSITFYP